MKHSHPYLFFNNGKCFQEMEQYRKIFRGELKVMKVSEAKQEMFKNMNQNLVLHSLLKTPNFQLMGSDNMNNDSIVGDNVCVYLECSSKAEVDQIYSELVKGGEDSMKPEDTFWGAYFGSLTDAFGVSWMLSY